MASMTRNRFFQIWFGIGAPAGIIVASHSYNYLDKTTDETSNTAQIMFASWSLTAGILTAFNWPLAYPLIIKEYLEIKSDSTSDDDKLVSDR